jgi:hypothetical protein
VFCWVPGHCGLPGNEVADGTATSVPLHGGLVAPKAFGSNVSTRIHRAILSSWQDECDNIQTNNLRVVKPSLQELQS